MLEIEEFFFNLHEYSELISDANKNKFITESSTPILHRSIMCWKDIIKDYYLQGLF